MMPMTLIGETARVEACSWLMELLSEETLKADVHPISSPPPFIPAFGGLITLWRSKFRAKTPPSWSDFDFFEFKDWHGRLAVSVFEGDELRFRLFGTDLCDLVGRDLTGKLLFEHIAPEKAPAVRAYFACLRAGPALGHASGHLPVAGREFIIIENLDLPLTDPSGWVSGFLHAAIRLKKEAGNPRGTSRKPARHRQKRSTRRSARDPGGRAPLRAACFVPGGRGIVSISLQAASRRTKASAPAARQ